MAMKRRGFLGGIAAAFATTPEKVLKAAGVGPSIGLGAPGPIPGGIASGAVGGLVSSSSGEAPWWMREKAHLIAMKTFAPWLLEKKRRAQARHVHCLDVNIASFRSVSPAAKIAMQRELQYRRQYDAELEGLELTAEERAFQS